MNYLGVTHRVSNKGLMRMSTLLPLPEDEQDVINQFAEIVNDYLRIYPSFRNEMSKLLIEKMT